MGTLFVYCNPPQQQIIMCLQKYIIYIYSLGIAAKLILVLTPPPPPQQNITTQYSHNYFNIPPNDVHHFTIQSDNIYLN